MISPALYTTTVDIYKGETWSLSLNWKDEAGALYALSTYTGTLTFYKENSSTVYKQLTSSSGIVLSNTQFNIVASMTRTETAALDFGPSKTAFAVLMLTNPGGSEDDRILEFTAALRN